MADAIRRSGGTKDDLLTFLRDNGLADDEIEQGLRSTVRPLDSIETWSEKLNAVGHVFAMTMVIAFVITYMALYSGASDRALIRMDIIETPLRHAGVTNGLVIALLLSLTIATTHSLAFFGAMMTVPAYERWCGFGILLLAMSSFACAIVL